MIIYSFFINTFVISEMNDYNGIHQHNDIKLILSQNAECDPSHTLHVDAFLYDEDMVDELCDTGELARNYCVDCSSHNTQPISESPTSLC